MTKPLALLAACALLYGCGGSGASDDPTTRSGSGELQYEFFVEQSDDGQPTVSSAVPSPNDLAFQGSEDGTLNLDPAVPAGETEPLDSQVSINSQDGFSTIASSTARFTVPVDGSTVTPGSTGTVRLFEVTPLNDPNGATQPAQGRVPIVDSLVRELQAQSPAEFTAGLSPADANGTTLAITPQVPLKPDTTYMAVVTNGIEEAGGGAIQASRQYQLLKSSQTLVDGNGQSQIEGLNDLQANTLDSIRPVIQSHLQAAGNASPAIDPADVVASWTFTTQTIGRSLTAVRGFIRNTAPPAVFTDGANNQPELVNTGQPTAAENPSGTIYSGVIGGLPYFLEPGGSDPTNVRTGFWAQDDGSPLNGGNSGANRLPALNGPETGGTVNVPVLVTIPNDQGAGAPYPVVIFQHGITSDRTAVLGIADELASRGMASVAIDLPLHGLVFQEGDNPCAEDPQSTACLKFSLWQEGRERHFGVDLFDNATLEPDPDGKVDASGTHFINLQSLRTSRDNLRQAVSDLFAVTNAIEDVSGQDLDSEPQEVGGMQIPAASGSQSLDASNIRFLGHSLGGIVGTPFLANEPNVGAAVIANAGGGIAKLLDGSPTLGDRIESGLEENGLIKGLSGYEQFLGAAQTLVDSGDPLNYAREAVSGTGRNVLGLEVVAGNNSLPDQVVPNVVSPEYPGAADSTIPSPTGGSSPLYGSPEPLPGVDFTGSGMALDQVGSGQSSAGDYLIQYVAGNHSTLLLPGNSPDAHDEMQTNVGSFLENGGNQFTTAGTGTIKP